MRSAVSRLDWISVHALAIRLIVVAGPTASGKSALAVALARAISGEVVNYDSVQLYRDFDVGSAKPGPEEMAGVHHHLLGVADAHHPWTAGEYARQARPVVEAVAGRGAVPLLTGGTGFYLRALLEGLSPAPPASEEVRRKLRARPDAHLRRLLQRLDPESAARIAPADRAKAIRALEVRLLSGRTLSETWRTAPALAWPRARVLKLGLNPDRQQLYRRIHRRAEAMFAGAIQEETRRLLPLYPPELRIWSSHGYKQAIDIVLHGADPAAALQEAQLEQRHYAKRQWTWFRRDREMIWLEGFGDEAALQQQAAEIAATWLRNVG